MGGGGLGLSLRDIEKGHYDILLSSPETILGKYKNTFVCCFGKGEFTRGNID